MTIDPHLGPYTEASALFLEPRPCSPCPTSHWHVQQSSGMQHMGQRNVTEHRQSRGKFGFFVVMYCFFIVQRNQKRKGEAWNGAGTLTWEYNHFNGRQSRWCRDAILSFICSNWLRMDGLNSLPGSRMVDISVKHRVSTKGTVSHIQSLLFSPFYLHKRKQPKLAPSGKIHLDDLLSSPMSYLIWCSPAQDLPIWNGLLLQP